jgi:cytochrome b pre-mRNA-processing protein 3
MLLVLHVWMIHKRLLKEGKPGLLVQEALFDELWDNTSNRIRGQGVNELSVIVLLLLIFLVCVNVVPSHLK